MDFQQLAEFRNRKNPHANRLGIFVEEIALGYARVSKTVTGEDLNPLGFTHGGIYFSIADTACGSAMASHGHQAVTLSANYNFLRSAQAGDVLTAEAREVKYGRTVCVYDVRITDRDGALLGSGSFTFYQKPELLEL